MQVLVVTNQMIKKDGNTFFTIENLYDILKRFSILGSLHICAKKYEGKSSNVLESDLSDLVKSENIHFIKPSYLKVDSKSRKILEKAISSVDLVIGYLPSLNASVA